jgi:hypothetical protein
VPRKTELEWTYSPPQFFPPGDFTTSAGTVRLAEGKAILMLGAPIDPVPPDVFAGAMRAVNALFLAQSVATRQAYTLAERPNTIQTADDGSRVICAVASSHLRITCHAPDFVLTGPDGIVRDTKVEREASQTSMLSDLATKIPRSATLADICQSYRRAIENPANEFVYLFEIIDRLKLHYGGREESAIAALDRRSAWKALGKLSNSAPVAQSRHRGSHDSPSLATEQELQTARAAALELIAAFARTV